MVNVVGVRFKKVGKIYYFDPEDQIIPSGESVIVETTRGLEFGTVEFGNREIDDNEIVPPLRKVIRIATESDITQEAANKVRETEAHGIFIDKALEHKLEMKLIDVELTFDLTKIIFYFTADGRVDFRELVKDLAAIFRMRIELRQIGVRDEAKILNGIGICGRTLCCATFLGDFQPVSIRMAKDQNLSLNPTKISGVCGRLMCCLKYEEETYEYLNRDLPNVGDIILTPDGEGEVLSVGVLRQLIRAAVRKREQDPVTVDFYSIDEIKTIVRKAVPPKDDGFDGGFADV
ncbi:MAG: stage 0 sporulation family protein [Clostridiales bacterium]|jgi:cell fate regulator YaaT (PSP1 superfamily)|nr:stage 0 sporulation family protein [Clostridiales bacterium]